MSQGDENLLKEASENWKLEVIRNLESRTSLQRPGLNSFNSGGGSYELSSKLLKGLSIEAH